MTRRTVEIVESNISGEPAEHEVTFQVNGTAYRLDLTDGESKQFHEVLAPYVSAAEILPATQKRRNADVAEVRAWAADQHISLSPTGRIPNDVWAKYEAAQSA